MCSRFFRPGGSSRELVCAPVPVEVTTSIGNQVSVCTAASYQAASFSTRLTIVYFLNQIGVVSVVIPFLMNFTKKKK